MNDEYQTYFESIYDSTHYNIQKYIASKFHDIQEIEDILQEVYLEFYKTLCKHGIDYVSEPEPFLITIAKKKLARRYSLGKKLKCLLPFIKTNDQEEEYTRSDFSDVDGSYNDIDEELISKETIDEVWQIINSKDSETVEIFKLRYLDELQMSQISEKTGIPLHTVKNKLYRTIEEIQSIFHVHEIDEKENVNQYEN